MSRRSNKRYYSRYEDRWPAYVPVAERRRKAELEMAKLRKKGVTVSPVTIEGRVIASTFWGKSWCENLESYHDYANRLERGRTYVRNGSVVDLQIAPREITATVSGSELYKIKVSIGEVAKTHWKSICTDCAGGIDSLVELLQGRFSKGVMERICRQGAGLFPKPAEIKFSCSCPDYASMCKHIAAVLYGVGARLDAQPELLFRLRAVDENDLLANIGQSLPLSKQAPASGKVLETGDMAALFGLDMADAEAPIASAAGAAPEKRNGRRTAASTQAAPKQPAPKQPAPKQAAPKQAGAPAGKATGPAPGKAVPAEQKPGAAPAQRAGRGVKPAEQAILAKSPAVVVPPPAAARTSKPAVAPRGKSAATKPTSKSMSAPKSEPNSRPMSASKPNAKDTTPASGAVLSSPRNARLGPTRVPLPTSAVVQSVRSTPAVPKLAATAPVLPRKSAPPSAKAAVASVP
jgi:uncharacterized Zn finger protein